MLRRMITSKEGEISLQNKPSNPSSFKLLVQFLISSSLVFLGAGLGSCVRYLWVQLFQLFWKDITFDLPIFFVNALSIVLITAFNVFLDPQKRNNWRVGNFYKVILDIFDHWFLRRIQYFFDLCFTPVFLLFRLLPATLCQRKILVRVIIHPSLQHSVRSPRISLFVFVSKVQIKK